MTANFANIPWRIDLQREAMDFRPLTRTQVAEATFLDNRVLGDDESFQSAPIAELLDAQKSAPKPRAPAYIIHTAFCCSTLLCRCLDAPGKALALKEPQIFIDLTSIRRWDGAKSGYPDLLRLTNGLLARPFESEERAIIKPSNGANDLLFDILGLDPEIQVLLLFADLRSFIISVLKRGEMGERFVRTVLRHPWSADARLSRLPADILQEPNADIKMAALLWRLQTDDFSRALQVYPAARVRALSADQFQNDPETALRALNVFFDLNVDDAHIAALTSGALFSEDAKKQRDIYDADQRQAAARAIEASHGEAIDDAIAWVRNLPLPPAAPLVSNLMQKDEDAPL